MIEMMILQSQINKLSTITEIIDISIHENITNPLYQRYYNFQIFLILVLLLIIIEITCQILYILNKTPFVIIILIYELVSLFVMLAFAYMFRPTVDLSPFYFMVPTSLEGETSSSSSCSIMQYHHILSLAPLSLPSPLSSSSSIITTLKIILIIITNHCISMISLYSDTNYK